MWKDLDGFEGLYKISDQGEIYSFIKGRLLKPHVSKNGYAYVSLCRPATGYKHYCTMHRLIAKAFVDGYKEGLFVNHKNEIKTDNRAENLEWCTKAYNNTYNGKALRCCKKVMQLSMTGEYIRSWIGAREASRALGIQYKNISAVCRAKRKSAGGYRWRFEGETNNGNSSNHLWKERQREVAVS